MSGDYPAVMPYLYYEDAAAALDWLTNAFGFRERLRVEDGGRVRHAELDVGDGVVLLGEPGPGYRNPSARGGATAGVNVYVQDVDAHYERATAAGAKILQEPADQEYGDRRYDCEDLEGHQWFFAQPIEGTS